MSAPGVTLLSDVSLLDDSARYPSCDDESVGSAVLKNTTYNTATVAYYTGTTPGSMACFCLHYFLLHDSAVEDDVVYV